MYSFPVHCAILFLTFSIYCYEVFLSIEAYKKFTATEEEKRLISFMEQLEHDENNPDRPNYHPLYVLVYMVYYFLLIFSMTLGALIDGFDLSLEIVLGLTVGYFILVCVWRPYHESINIHNHFLKLNHGVVAVYLAICELFNRLDKMSVQLYITLMYGIIVLLGVIVVGGFVRIFI